MNRRVRRVLTFVVGLVLAACTGSAGVSPSNAPTQIPAGSSPAAQESAASTGAGGAGGATGQPVTDPSNVEDLLGPGDFAATGVAGTGPPTVSRPEPGSTYIVYGGSSGATGGVELDVFIGDTAAAAGATFEAVAAPLVDFEGRGKAQLPGADDARLRSDNPVDGGGEWAGVAVRKGRLVFLISVPGSPSAERQLVDLAKLVLERAGGLQ